MPSYKVLQKGFLDGITYDPTGKRRTVHVDKPFKKTPSWLEPIKAESAAVKKKRESAEKKTAQQNADAVTAGKQDIAEASFLGTGESSTEAGGAVETL